MSKILISWYAKMHDFVIEQHGGKQRKLDDKVNEDGPTFNVHRYYGDQYDKHILLCSSIKDEDTKFFKLLVKELEKNFSDKIEPVTLSIDDPIDISEIFQKVSAFLLPLKNEKIEIFVSPGTPQMQIAWYLVKPNFKKNVTLFQLREKKFTKDKERPERVYSNVDTLFNPSVISVANEIIEREPDQKRILITESLQPIYDKAEQVAKTNNVGCLILGENGTGKENLALHIHKHSGRNKNSFKAINCAAFTDELLRSELFGHEKGSFTGADTQKKGIFEEANDGTIFLDEIGDVSPKMQVSLLRAIQEKKIQRVGGTKEIPVDVRIIAATNRDIESLCEEGKFRWDLYFRLAVTTIKLPALRDFKKKEINGLIDHFNTIYFSEFPNRTEKLKFNKEALDNMLKYYYKGNIRELQNLILSLYTFCENVVTPADLPERMLKEENKSGLVKDYMKEIIIKSYNDKNKNLKATAESLGIARQTLYSKLKEYGIK